jgi:hypothetical protein
MALTKAHTRMIEGDDVSVLDFGATGDGVTDDTVAIQAALDSILERGEILLFPAGEYKVSAPLILPTRSSDRLIPLALVGESFVFAPEEIGTVIRYTGTTGSLFEGRGASGTDTRRGMLAFKNINMEGQYVTGTSSTNTSVGLNLYYPTGIDIENCMIRGFKYGAKFDQGGSWYSRIEFTRFRNCDIGLYINGAVNGTTLTNCAFSSFDSNCINATYTSWGFNIEGCWFEAASGDQIAIGAGARQLVVNNCYFEYSGTGYAVSMSRYGGSADVAGTLTFTNNNVQVQGTHTTAPAVIYIFNDPTSTEMNVFISGCACEIETGSPVLSLVQSTGDTTLVRITAPGAVGYRTGAGYRSLALHKDTYGRAYFPSRVGINTTAPQAPLDVAGDVITQDLYVNRSASSGTNRVGGPFLLGKRITNSDVVLSSALDLFDLTPVAITAAGSEFRTTVSGTLTLTGVWYTDSPAAASCMTEVIHFNVSTNNAATDWLIDSGNQVSQSSNGSAYSFALGLSATTGDTVQLQVTITGSALRAGITNRELYASLQFNGCANSNSLIVPTPAT